MYLSKNTILLGQVIALLLMIGMWFLVFIGLFGLISDFLSPAGNSVDIATALGILISSAVFLVLAISTLRLIGKANKFNNTFRGNDSDVLQVSGLAALFGMPEQKCIQLFDKLIQRGYLTCCHLDRSGTPVIVLHDPRTENSYIVKHKTRTVLFVAMLLSGFSKFMLYMCIYGFVTMFGGDADTRTAVPTWAALTVMSLGMLFLARALRHNVQLARRFNSLFSSDADGEISVERTAALLGMPAHKLANQFDQLCRMGYLFNCHLAVQPEPRIILINNGRKATECFTAVTCPNCGASNSLKAGFIGKCQYCDSKIEV